MTALGNLIWFVFGGEILALVWLLLAGIFALTIMGIPISRACLEFAKLSAFPFGKEVIRDTELKGKDNVSTVVKVVSIVLNVIWFPIGLIFSIVYLVSGILSFISIIGIPVGVVYVCMAAFVLFPIGARVVSKKQAYASAAANEMEKRGLGKGNNATIIVNANPASQGSEIRISAEKQILTLVKDTPVLTLAQIVSQTSLELDKAETTVKKLVDKGIAQEEVDSDGKTKYRFQ
jgi:uncharacterized membrane protein YccF (DUF307 family)